MNKNTQIRDINNGMKMLLRSRYYSQKEKITKFELDDDDYIHSKHSFDRMNMDTLNSEMKYFIESSATIMTRGYIEYDRKSGSYWLCIKMRNRNKIYKNQNSEYM